MPYVTDSYLKLANGSKRELAQVFAVRAVGGAYRRAGRRGPQKFPSRQHP